jgi:RNA polymerase sigma-70 factor (ECF subfamily)
MSSLAESAFRRHYSQIYRYLRQRTNGRDEAEELSQLVFTDAVSALQRFRPGATPVLALLYTVAQRRLADAARARANGCGELVSLESVRAERQRESEYGPLVAAELRRAIAALPRNQREVVVLKLLEGRPYAEIARRLGASESACRMRMARALRALRTTLAERGVTP